MPLSGVAQASGWSGLYVFLGITPLDQDPAKAAPNHNPGFFVDDSALVVSARTMATLAVDFLAGPTKKEGPLPETR